ncbi:hypothetical protein MMMDOFMJ_3503 [Methylobacterium gnaphalii]|uniref:PilZ domain-containing protein n=1 Tax=Methylobacterium gnaphalii TaxID=1010610 RepID=A0A512JQK1_9HYPH|nr:hypothetical protein MGN01_40790 [Methylobacterium gnaphalii]GJD70554.1 hypothetical protein MMMDOFMJ_3503 [Methylobacterium gnaphalii]GLS48527.1 hypothetical protein GCM10007885_13710 [Methylobacterium gnaphalii]
MSEERRTIPRSDVFRLGSILLDHGTEVPVCLTLNLTDRGAKLEVEDPASLPDVFQLIPSSDARPRPCRVLWRLGTKMGVMFTD